MRRRMLLVAIVLCALPLVGAAQGSPQALAEGYHQPLYSNDIQPYLNDSVVGSDILRWNGTTFELRQADAAMQLDSGNLNLLTDNGKIKLDPSQDAVGGAFENATLTVTQSQVGVNTRSPEEGAALDVSGSLVGGSSSLGSDAGTTEVALGKDAFVNASGGAAAIGQGVSARGEASFALGANVTASQDESIVAGFGREELVVADTGIRVRTGTNIYNFTTDKDFDNATDNELPTAKAVRNFTLREVGEKGLPRVLQTEDTADDGQRIEIDKIQARDGDGLALYDDGNSGVFVEDGGNVGVGETNPGKKLEVDGTARVDLGHRYQLEIGDGSPPNIFNVDGQDAKNIGDSDSIGATNRFLFAGHSAGGVDETGSIVWYGGGTGGGPNSDLYFSATDHLRRNADGTSNFNKADMMIDTGGDVGIGTNSPGNILDVSSSGANEGLQLTDSSSNELAVLAEQDTDAGYLHLKDGGTTNIALESSSGKDVYFNTGGNVGVGTTSPESKLDVEGDVTVNDNDVNGVNQADFTEETQDKALWHGGGYVTGVESGTLYWESDGGRFRWYTGDNDAGSSDIMRLNSSELRLEQADLTMQDHDINVGGTDTGLVGGRIGVGTSSPSKQLEVNGDISVSSEGQKLRFANDDDSAILRSDNGASSSNSLITRSKASLDLIADSNDGGGSILTFGAGGQTPASGSYQEWARFSGSGSLTFQQDDTGPVADQMFAADGDGLLLGDQSGTAGVFVEDGGQVAVGSTSPSYSLDVTGDVNTDSSLRTAGTTRVNAAGKFFAAGSQGYSFVGDGDTAVKAPSADTVTVTTSGSERVRVDSSGEVGVGTAAPDRQLDVEDSGNVWTSTRSTGTGNDAGYLVGNANNWQGSLRWDDATSELRLGTRAGSTQALRIGQSNKVTVQAGNLNVNDNDIEVGGSDTGITGGNLGIGTSSPNEKVTVQGDGVDLTGRDEDNSRMWSLEGTTAGDNGILGLYEDGTEQISLDSRSGQPSYFDSGSNVGIGESNPSSKLDVVGGVEFNGDLDMTDNDHSGDGDIRNVNELNVAEISSNKGSRIEILSGQGPLDLNANSLVGVNRVGGSGEHLDFDDHDYVEVQDGGGSRSEIVTQDTYVNEDGFWLGAEDLTHIDTNNGLAGGGTNGLTDPVDIRIATDGVADDEIKDNTVDNSEIQNTDQFQLTGTGSGPQFQVKSGNGAYNGVDISMDDDNSNNDYGLRVRFEDGNSFDTSGDVAFTVQPDENTPQVGIDTNTPEPGSTLDVSGALVSGSSTLGSGADGTSVALGDQTTASGANGATALGYDTTASGDNGATALGRGITAAGQSSLAIGLNDQSGTTVSAPNTMAVMGGSVGVGTTTPTSLLNVDGYAELGLGTAVNEFSTDEDLTDNSDDALPTEQAVKQYAREEIRQDACNGSHVYLDGEGVCTDFKTDNDNFLHGDLIQSNTVDNTEVENSDAFTFNGVTSNSNVDLQDNNVVDVAKIDGDSGDHRIRFDSSSNYIEFTDQSNTRQQIVTEDTYVNEDSFWLGDEDLVNVSANNGLTGGGQKGLTDTVNVGIAADGVADDEIKDNTVDDSEIQNSDAFTFNGATLNSDLNMNGNSVNAADDVETNDVYDDDSDYLRVQDSIDLDNSASKAIDFDGGDAMITVHDGTGNFNIKAGVDQGGNIVSGSGGSHIQMSDGGNISLRAADSGTGSFSASAELDVNSDVNVRSAQLDLNNNNINNVNNVYGDGGSDVTFQDRPQSQDGLYVDSGTAYFDGEIRTDVIQDRSSGNTIRFDSNLDVNGNDVSGIADITLNKGTNINEFSTDTSLSDSSNDALPTENAVKVYVDDNAADGECSGQYTFLAGDGGCEDFTTDTDNFIHGDLIKTNTVDNSEVDADSLSGDDLGGNNNQIDLKNTIDVNQINSLDFIDHASTGVDMNWDGSNNYIEFEDYDSNSNWLRINNGGPVQVLDTNLDMTGENINGINSLSGQGDSISTSDEIQVNNGDGSTTYFNYNDGGSQNYIRGSRLQVDTTDFYVNTGLDMQSNRVFDIGSNDVNFQSDSDLDMNNRNILDANSLELQNIESVGSGEIGRDNSIGFLGNWGGNGNAVLWDAYNVIDGNAISVTGGKGQESNPTIAVSADGIADDEIKDNTVDDSEIQNGDAFTFNGVTSNSNVDLQDNNVVDVAKIDGDSGDHRIRFDSSSNYIEFTDQSNTRQPIVTEDTYVNEDGFWLGDEDLVDVSANNGLTGGGQKGLTDTVNVGIAADGVADDEIKDNTVDDSEIQNSDAFTFNGVTSNADINVQSNNVDNVECLGDQCA